MRDIPNGVMIVYCKIELPKVANGNRRMGGADIILDLT